MPINRIINNEEKELTTIVRYINNEEKECQRIVQIINNEEKDIWTGNKVIKLPAGKNVDVKPYLPKIYKYLTNANFFIIEGSRYLNASVKYTSTTLAYSSYQYDQSYNSSTGVVTNYLDYHAGRTDRGGYSADETSIALAVCTKPEKLIYLGNRSFDVKTLYPNDYQKFTNDNFLCRLPNFGDLTDAGRERRLTSKGSLVKSYDPNTGIITCYIYSIDAEDENNQRNADIYLYKGKIRTE